MSLNRGRRIRKAMGQRRINKHCALAAAMGVSESAVSRWCQGGPMTLTNVIALCQYLDVSADWLLLGRGDMEQHRQSATWPAELPFPDLCDRARAHLIRVLQDPASGY